MISGWVSVFVRVFGCLCGCLLLKVVGVHSIVYILSVACSLDGRHLQVHGQNRVVNSKVTTFAGSGTPGYADGLGVIAMFNVPTDIVWDAVNGTFYVCDSGNRRIRAISPSGGALFDFCFARCPRTLAFDHLPHFALTLSLHMSTSAIFISLGGLFFEEGE